MCLDLVSERNQSTSFQIFFKRYESRWEFKSDRVVSLSEIHAHYVLPFNQESRMVCVATVL